MQCKLNFFKTKILLIKIHLFKKVSGDCTCKENVEGQKCDQCKMGYHSLIATNPDGCTKCDCDPNGTKTSNSSYYTCDVKTGQCPCTNKNVAGIRCDRCKELFYNVSNSCSELCACNSVGAINPFCNYTNGQCLCRTNVIGRQCDQCKPGFFNLTQWGCLDSCVCSKQGSIGDCSPTDGKCQCKQGYAGRQCDTCANGYFQSGAEGCKKCNCNPYGSMYETSLCDKVIKILII